MERFDLNHKGNAQMTGSFIYRGRIGHRRQAIDPRAKEQ